MLSQKALAMQASGLDFKPQNTYKSYVWWKVPVVPWLERHRQADAWGIMFKSG